MKEPYKMLENWIEQEKKVEPNPFAGTRILQRIENEFVTRHEESVPALLKVFRPVSLTLALILGLLIGAYTARDNAEMQIISNASLDEIRNELYISEIMAEDHVVHLSNQGK